MFFLESATAPIHAQQKFPSNCYRPKPQEEYRCFLLLSEENRKRAQEKKPKNKPLLGAQQRKAKRLADEARRKRELEILQRRVETSRSRNVTNKGRKYRVTYGRVAEPRINCPPNKPSSQCQ